MGALRDRLAAKRAEERMNAILATPFPPRPRMGYPLTRPNAEAKLKPAAPGFGALLRSHRLRANLSMTECAKRSGWGNDLVRRLEEGESEPTRRHVAALARTLELDEDATAEMLISAGFLPAGWTAVNVGEG